MANSAMGFKAQLRSRTASTDSPAAAATSQAAGLARAVAAAAADEAAAAARSILVLLPDGSLRMYDEHDLTVADVLADFPHHDLAECASQPSRARLPLSRRLKPEATYYLKERVQAAKITRFASVGCLLTLPPLPDEQSTRRCLQAHERPGSFHEIPDQSRYHSVSIQSDAHHNDHGHGYGPQHQHHHQHQQQQEDEEEEHHDRGCQHIQRTRHLSYSSCASVQSTSPLSSFLLSPSAHGSNIAFSHPPVSPHGAHHFPCPAALSTVSTPPPFSYPSSSASSSSASSAFSHSSSVRCVLNPIAAELDLLEAEEDQYEDLRLNQTSAPHGDYPCTSASSSSSSSSSDAYATHSEATLWGRPGAKTQSVFSRTYSPSPSPTAVAQARPRLSPGGKGHGGAPALAPTATTTTPTRGSTSGGGGKGLAAKIKASILKLDPRSFRQISGKDHKQRFPGGEPQSAQEGSAASDDAAATDSADTQAELRRLRRSMTSRGSKLSSIDVASSRLEEASLVLPGHVEVPTMCLAPRLNRAVDDYISSDAVFLSGPVRSHVWY